MRNSNEYSIKLNLYNKNNPGEITRFFSVVFDTRKVNFSVQNKEKLVDELGPKIKLKDLYRQANKLLRNKEFLIQDPDGYLLRFIQDLGEK